MEGVYAIIAVLIGWGLAFNKIAGFNFHNRSQFSFDKLIADPNNVSVNLRNYINGFSSSAADILALEEKTLETEKTVLES